jgi:hypothetical protein
MRIEELRAWHWVLIGLFVGLMFGVAHRAAGHWFDTDDLPTLSPIILEQLVIGRPAPSPLRRFIPAAQQQQPMVKNLVVHPPVAGDPSASNWVTGKMYEIVARPADPARPSHIAGYYEEWEPFKCRATLPYKATAGAPGKYPNIIAYLTAVQKKSRLPLAFRYAWWEQPTLALLLPTAAGLLIIGIAWPLSIALMQGAGLTRPPQKTKSARSRSTTTGSATTPPRDTSAGDRQLATLNDQLESSLAAGASDHASNETPSTPAPAPAVTPLGIPEPASAAACPGQHDPTKEYGGEFYPVAKPAGKPTEV